MSVADRQCPDDLLVRGNRHQVSQLERRALDAHLGQCASCRAASALAVLFDAVPETQPGDRELLGRVARRATRKRPVVRRWTRAVAAAAALLVFSGGVAVAWVTVGRRVVESRHAEKAAAPRPDRGRLSHRAAAVSSGEIPALAPAVEVPPQVPAIPEIAAPAVARQRPAPPRSAVVVVPSMKVQAATAGDNRIEPLAVDRMPAATRPETLEPPATRPSPFLAPPAGRREDAHPAPPDAPALFTEANAVRRAGELGRAVGLYQRLRREFPLSAQALLASVSVGDLLLRLGDPVGAVAAYESYLDHSAGGPLTEEALFGRARALARLGHGLEERQTWEDLVRRFPRSAYHPAAAKRLGELKH